MKKVVIVEDEVIASDRLSALVLSVRPDYQIVGCLQSVVESIDWFSNNDPPDLVFMDIQLSDGLSFSIFSEVNLPSSIIFTTAYDQYALKAFEVNSIDYLLKPVLASALTTAIVKYESWSGPSSVYPPQLIQTLIDAVAQKKYKSRFLVKTGKHLHYLNQQDICFFYSENGVLFCWSMLGKRHILDGTLELLESTLDPDMFFRINRKAIIHIQAIQSIHPHLNNRLKVQCHPSSDFDLIVARERSSDFKKWVDGQVNR